MAGPEFPVFPDLSVTFALELPPQPGGGPDYLAADAALAEVPRWLNEIDFSQGRLDFSLAGGPKLGHEAKLLPTFLDFFRALPDWQKNPDQTLTAGPLRLRANGPVLVCLLEAGPSFVVPFPKGISAILKAGQEYHSLMVEVRRRNGEAFSEAQLFGFRQALEACREIE